MLIRFHSRLTCRDPEPARMKTLYLHIGTHKTASSTLQLFFARNKNRLARSGFYYPVEGSYYLGIENSQSLLSHSLRNARPAYIPKRVNFTRQGCIADIRRDIQNSACENVLVSSEHFSHSATHEEVEAIRSAFSQVVSTIKVIVYLRRQDQRIESGYNQQVKSGLVFAGFREYAEGILADPGNAFRYDLLLGRFAEVFGEENIIARPFEKGQLHPQGIIFDFLEILGVEPATDFPVPQALNKSLPAEMIEVMRLIGAHFPGIEHRRMFNRFVMSAPLGIDNRPHTFFTDELRNRVLTAFEASNRLVAKKYLGRESGELFRESAKGELPLYEGLSAERLAQISARIWALQESRKALLRQEPGRQNPARGMAGTTRQ